MVSFLGTKNTNLKLEIEGHRKQPMAQHAFLFFSESVSKHRAIRLIRKGNTKLRGIECRETYCDHNPRHYFDRNNGTIKTIRQSKERQVDTGPLLREGYRTFRPNMNTCKVPLREVPKGVAKDGRTENDTACDIVSHAYDTNTTII